MISSCLSKCTLSVSPRICLEVESFGGPSVYFEIYEILKFYELIDLVKGADIGLLFVIVNYVK